MSIEALRAQHCKPRKGRENRLDVKTIADTLADLPGWKVDGDSDSISREFRFPDYFHTMAFVNAVASIAHREDHHPDLEVGYGYCRTTFTTHAIKGLSENDFICAAKIDLLPLN